jgi:hypothetical protein
MSYNLCIGGQGAVGKMIPTEATKLKMAEATKTRHSLYGHPNTGKKFGKRDKEIYVRAQATKKINGFKTRKGQKNSEEQKNNQRLAALNRPKHECPHCQREFTIQTMTRWHGNKCVMRS